MTANDIDGTVHKLSAKEKDEAMYKLLQEGVKHVLNSANYKDFLNTMAKFTYQNYSINNLILLHMQGAEFPVASYKNWQRDFERQVQPGSKALMIIQPCTTTKVKQMPVLDDNGNPVLDANGNQKMEDVKVTVNGFKRGSVFSVTDTEGKPLPEICTELEGVVEGYDDYIAALREVSPVPIKFTHIDGNAKGFFDKSEGNGSITIKSGMSEVATIKTGIHEVCHSLIQSIGAEHEHIKKELGELIAESTAWIVCSKLGIDVSDYSFEYLASWSSDEELTDLKSCLSIIKDNADKIYNGIEQSIKAQMDFRAQKVESLIDNLNQTMAHRMAM